MTYHFHAIAMWYHMLFEYFKDMTGSDSVKITTRENGSGTVEVYEYDTKKWVMCYDFDTLPELIDRVLNKKELLHYVPKEKRR